MGANSKIEWTDHTFNPWVGCTKVSAACDHCYAEGWANRTGQSALWRGERRRTSERNWAEPCKWNSAAGRAGVRFRVFCASLADVFDNQVPAQWRRDLFALIALTPRLDWLLLTKRPQNAAKMIASAIDKMPGAWPWPNVWLGTTVENQEEADRRIPHLLATPAAVRFLSCEPLLSAIDISEHLFGLPGDEACPTCPRDEDCECGWRTRQENGRPSIGWVICGGESGAQARPMHPDWARSLRDQCAAADVAFHFKQHGEHIEIDGPRCRAVSVHRKPTDFWLLKDGSSVPLTGHRTSPTAWEQSLMRRVGKKNAGRLLDGVEHNSFPEMA